VASRLRLVPGPRPPARALVSLLLVVVAVAAGWWAVASLRDHV
jgi:hypothetical protein